MASFTQAAYRPWQTTFKDENHTQVEVPPWLAPSPWQAPTWQRALVSDENYTQVELPEWQELTPRKIDWEDVIDQHGGPEAVPKMSIKKAKNFHKLVDAHAPRDYPPKRLDSPTASEYGDSPTRELFEDPILSSATANKEAKLKSAIGRNVIKRGLDDYSLSSPQPKKQRTMAADQHSIDKSVVVQSQYPDGLGGPQSASFSRSAAEIGREVRKKTMSSLKGRKLHRYTANEKFNTHGNASQCTEEEAKVLLASSSGESESGDSAVSSESDSGNRSYIIDSIPTTPEEVSEDEEFAEVLHAHLTDAKSPTSGTSRITDSYQRLEILEATATPVDRSSPITPSPSEVNNFEPESFESSAALKESHHTPGLKQGEIEVLQQPEYGTKARLAIREDIETLNVPSKTSEKEKNLLKPPRRGRKNHRKPFKTTASRVDKCARVTRSKAKANNIIKFEKLDNAGRLPVDWNT